MSNPFAPYECQFTEDERKRMIGQTVTSVRKGKGYSQKEVRWHCWESVKQRTAHDERGQDRTAHGDTCNGCHTCLIARLIILVQRDRLARTNEDAQKQIDELKRQLQECEEQTGSQRRG